MSEAKGCNQPIVHQAFLHCVPTFKLCTLHQLQMCAWNICRELPNKILTDSVASEKKEGKWWQSVSHGVEARERPRDNLCHTTSALCVTPHNLGHLYLYLCTCILVYFCICREAEGVTRLVHCVSHYTIWSICVFVYLCMCVFVYFCICVLFVYLYTCVFV